MSTNKKILVLGLDGATWKLLKPYADKGYMPTLKKLMERGTHGRLRSTIPAMTAPSWATFSTGKQPCHHGVFDFMLPIDSLDNMKVATSEDVKSKMIYEIVRDNGRTPIIINLPPSYPPRLNNPDDIVITCLLTQGDQWIFPDSLKKEFPSLENYRLTPDESLRIKDRKEAYIDDLLLLIEQQVTSVKELFERKPWDFFFYLFSQSDWVSHLAYADLEADAPSPRRVFEAIDRHLQWFVDHLPEGADLVLVSDHGFKAYNKIFYFNRWLEQEGYLTTVRNTGQFHTPATRRAVERLGKEAGKKRLNLGTGLFKFLSYIPAGEKMGRWLYTKIITPYLPWKLVVNVGIDHSKTKVCFPKGAYITNAYINKDWVYNNGTVSREEYPALLKEVVGKMQAIVDKDGLQVIKKVLTRQEVYPGGDAPDTAPDIFFELDEYWLVGQFASMSLIDREEQNKHDEYGIFLGVGPSFAAGKTVEGLQMQDMTPLLLHLMNLPVPSDCDGHVPLDVLAPGSEPALRPIQTGAPSAWDPVTRTVPGKPATEKAAISAALGKIRL